MLFGYENKETYPIYILRKCCEEKRVDLLLIGEGKRHYVLIKDFNTFKYNHTLHQEKSIFAIILYKLLLQKVCFKLLLQKDCNKDCFNINDKQKILMSKNGEYVKLENYERKTKSPFIIYADFESILVP